MEDTEIFTEDLKGLVSLNENGIAIALDIEITKELELEGYAREFINKIQNKE